MEAAPPEPTGPSYKLVLTGEGISIDRQLDAETALTVVEIVMAGKAESKAPPPGQRAKKTSRRRTTADNGKPRKSGRRGTSSPSIVRDLSLRPDGKQSFMDFADEKRPRSHFEKQAVAVYWLSKSFGMQQGITIDHINTCYVGANWKRPANFENSVQVSATRKGWIDTSDGSDIRITVPGEDVVVHDLPSKSE
jgi:hypothetical protein